MNCTKRKFLSKNEAKIFLRTNNSERRDEPPLVNVYRCLRCEQWHVTHLSKEEGRSLVRNGILQKEPNQELERLRASVIKHKPK